MLGTPMNDQPTSRDETAFSLDPFTGAPSSPAAVIGRATTAMQALDAGHVDEDGYHQLLNDDEAYAAFIAPKEPEGSPEQGLMPPEPEIAVEGAEELVSDAPEAAAEPTDG